MPGVGRQKYIGVIWALLSAIGASIGVLFALWFFPEAGFARNPTGHYSWKLVGFALFVGTSFGLMQCVAIVVWMKKSSKQGVIFVSLWFLSSSVSVAAMILPLWGFDAIVLVFAPELSAVSVSFGASLLAISQGLIIRYFFKWKSEWMLWTFIGALAGAAVGLPFAIFTNLVIPFISVELLWAGFCAGSIGAFQGNYIGALMGEQTKTL